MEHDNFQLEYFRSSRLNEYMRHGLSTSQELCKLNHCNVRGKVDRYFEITIFVHFHASSFIGMPDIDSNQLKDAIGECTS